MRILVALTALLVLAPCAAHDSWQEETLMQLAELRKAQGEMKQQIADLQAEVARLRAGGSGSAQGGTSLDLRKPEFPSLGDANAQIAIVEFSDFQCPYCRKHEQTTLPALTEKYLSTGKARYFFVDYPLSFHPQAADAAVAGVCAHQQGGFWKMHNLLFDSQNTLGPSLYMKLARDAGLDANRFKACLGDPKVKQQITEHTALGDASGVQGTPAFLIGRMKDGVLTDARVLTGAQPLARFEQALLALDVSKIQ